MVEIGIINSTSKIKYMSRYKKYRKIKYMAVSIHNTNMNKQYKYQYTNSKTEILVHKYISIHKNKFSNINTQIYQ